MHRQIAAEHEAPAQPHTAPCEWPVVSGPLRETRDYSRRYSSANKSLIIDAMYDVERRYFRVIPQIVSVSVKCSMLSTRVGVEPPGMEGALGKIHRTPSRGMSLAATLTPSELPPKPWRKMMTASVGAPLGGATTKGSGYPRWALGTG